LLRPSVDEGEQQTRLFRLLDPSILAGPDHQFDVLRTLCEQLIKVALAVRHHGDAGRCSQHFAGPLCALDPALRFLVRRCPLAPERQLFFIAVPDLHRHKAEQRLRPGFHCQRSME
jgi:hypothetical protein